MKTIARNVKIDEHDVKSVDALRYHDRVAFPFVSGDVDSVAGVIPFRIRRLDSVIAQQRNRLGALGFRRSEPATITGYVTVSLPFNPFDRGAAQNLAVRIEVPNLVLEVACRARLAARCAGIGAVRPAAAWCVGVGAVRPATAAWRIGVSRLFVPGALGDEAAVFEMNLAHGPLELLLKGQAEQVANPAVLARSEGAVGAELGFNAYHARWAESRLALDRGTAAERAVHNRAPEHVHSV